MFIENATVEMMVEPISKICRLGGIDPPPNGREFIAFIQISYGKYPYDILDKAVISWVNGHIDVKAPKVMNVKFMSDVVRLYIESNRHNIQKKEREYLMIKAEENRKADMIQVAKTNYTKVKNGEKVNIYPLTMALAFDELGIEPTGNVLDKIEFIKTHEAAMRNEMLNKLGKNKIKSDYGINDEIYHKAAKFALWCDGQG
jgi:hypothetical protein